MKTFKFNKDFLFGGSINGIQCEGNGNFKKGKTIWDKFFELNPDKFYDGIGPIKQNDFQNHYKDDIKLLKEAGIQILRYQIQWSSLMPDGTNVSKESLKWYHDLFAELNKNGIKVLAPLVAFDTPLWAQEIGGWANREVQDKFYEFAKFVFTEFKDDVYKFATFIEPTPMIEGILYGWHWPIAKNYKEAIEVLYGIVLANAKAMKAWRDVNNGKEIGVIFNNPVVYSASDDMEDKVATDMFRMLWIDAFQEPMIKGAFKDELIAFWKTNSLMPSMQEGDLELISKVKPDFIGINYYQPNRIARPKKENARNEVWPLNYYSHHHDPKARMNLSRGWEIFPQAIYDACMEVKNKYGNIPFMITENGLAIQGEEEFAKDNIVNDKYRTDFYAEHLFWLHKAIEDGANLKGYMIWSPIDNWSWLNAYKNRYGLIRVDLNNLKRYPKNSSEIFSEWSKTKEVKWDDENVHPLINQRKEE